MTGQIEHPKFDEEGNRIYTGVELRRARRKARHLGLSAANGRQAIDMLAERGISLDGEAPISSEAEKDNPNKPDVDDVDTADKPEDQNKPPAAKARNRRRLKRQRIAAAQAQEKAQQPRKAGVPARRPEQAQPPTIITKEDRDVEIRKLEQKIQARRNRNIRKMVIRLFIFVFLPTFLCGLYYYKFATPLFASHSEMNVEQASIASAPSAGGLLSGTPFAGGSEMVAIQGFLNSRRAFELLESDIAFSELFTGDEIDRFRRIDQDATDEEKYKNYLRHVKVSYDNTDQILRMEVRTPDQESSVKVSQLLIGYAEEQIDKTTQRVRDTGLEDAQILLDNAGESLQEAKINIIKLQENQGTLSPLADKEVVIQAIVTLEQQKTLAETSLSELQLNARPNQARVDTLIRQIELFETRIEELTEEANEVDQEGLSITRLDQEMKFAETDLVLRTTQYELALQNTQMAQAQARSQRKFLTTSLEPTATFAPIYPKKLFSTLSAFLLFFAFYVFLSITVEVLREQVAM